MPDEPLQGCAILVVEDEYMLAADLKKDLLRAGATVIGPVASLDQAIDLIESTPRLDGAILDVSLQGELVYPAADLLSSRGTPFVLATGYDRSVIPKRFEHVTRCEKPVAPKKMLQKLRAIFQPAS